ncbi:hypothetical protein RGQ29_015829 [Quercus rubra]|uniref:Uncharacterized protein n=1 Tax=Quercus rubra TaxID=3512 RepID=A0AAN7J551_QUERU|nr:hypothetical protein RGQ29_015829 [Quercus rubra]
MWRLSPRLSRRAKSVMNLQRKVTSEGSVNRRRRNLHKLSYSQFGFQYYWLMSPASYTVILPLHLSQPHDPHCAEGITVAAASKDSTLKAIDEGNWKKPISCNSNGKEGKLLN